MGLRHTEMSGITPAALDDDAVLSHFAFLY